MLQIMYMISLFLIGFAFGWLLGRKVVTSTEKLMEMEKTKKDTKNNTIDIVVERHNNRFFLYRKKDGQFLCHGDSAEEVMLAFEDRFPDQDGNIVSGDLDAIEDMKKFLN